MLLGTEYDLAYTALCLGRHALYALLWSWPAWLLMLTTYSRGALDRRTSWLCTSLGVALAVSSHWWADVQGLGF